MGRRSAAQNGVPASSARAAGGMAARPEARATILTKVSRLVRQFMKSTPAKRGERGHRALCGRPPPLWWDEWRRSERLGSRLLVELHPETRAHRLVIAAKGQRARLSRNPAANRILRMIVGGISE